MKSKTLKLGVSLVLMLTFSLVLTGQEKKAPNLEKLFQKFDADKNGSISLEEFKSRKRKKEVPANRLEKSYARLDDNSDGQVTLEEFKTNWKNKGKKK